MIKYDDSVTAAQPNEQVQVLILDAAEVSSAKQHLVHNHKHQPHITIYHDLYFAIVLDLAYHLAHLYSVVLNLHCLRVQVYVLRAFLFIFRARDSKQKF